MAQTGTGLLNLMNIFFLLFVWGLTVTKTDAEAGRLRLNIPSLLLRATPYGAHRAGSLHWKMIS